MKQAKNKLKSGGETELYKEALEELLLVKEKEWKFKEERYRETKEIQEHKVSFAEHKLMWDQQQ